MRDQWDRNLGSLLFGGTREFFRPQWGFDFLWLPGACAPAFILAPLRGSRRPEIMDIGVISDTHGLLRPEAVEALQGSRYIIHAGDVGDPAILERLAEIAPVTAVRGNIDKGAWARKLPESNVLQVAGICIYLLHEIDRLDLMPEAAGFSAVIYGHSHVPKQETKNGVLYFNPGSAGPKRFSLPISVGRLTIADGGLKGEVIDLHDEKSHPRRTPRK